MPVYIQYFLALFFVCTCLLPRAAAAGAGERPLWEAGIGLAPVVMSSYRGSENVQWYLLPMPYLDYRGDFLRVDREGIRGLLYDSVHVRVDLSGDGTIPAETDEEGPRRGMPDLDPVIEFGPSINLILHEGFDTRIRLRMPVRMVAATDFSSISHLGWKVHPHLEMDFREAICSWNAGVSIGPLFADRGVHEFYYEVKPRYETDFRNAYHADAGYSGTMARFTFSRRFENLWAGFFLRYDNLDGAAFIDSPLVETRHAFMAGFGFAVIFGRSKRTVPATWDD